MKGVTLDFSRPGKPTDNAFIESFNGDYNEVRPHSAIGNKTPIELHRTAASPAGGLSEEARIF